MTTQFISSEPPAIRRESDVIAYAATTLGYWPQHSLALIIAPDRMVGPVLRVDANLAQPEDAADLSSVLAQTLLRAPGLLDGGGQLFAVFFGDTEHPRNKHIKNPMEQLAIDQEEAELTAPFVEELHRFATQHHLTFGDALYVGADTYWGVLYPAYRNVLVGNTQEILESPLNIFMISEGKKIDDTHNAFIEASLWNPLPQSKENKNWFHDARRWFDIYQTKNQENHISSHAGYRKVTQSQLCIWENSLTKVFKAISEIRNRALRNHGCFQPVDHLEPTELFQHFPAQIAGYLAATFTETTFIHHLLYLTMTNQKMSNTVLNSFQILSEMLDGEDETEATPSCVLPLGTGEADIEKLCLELLGTDFITKKPVSKQAAMRNLDKIAKTISGNQESKPHWNRIDALEIICLILVEISGHHEKFNILTTIAWINWLKGKSSLATKILQEAQEHEHDSEPILLAALQSSSLPYIALNPETSWARHSQKLNNS